MLNIARQSKLSPELVARKAEEFFGPGGLGLSAGTSDDGNLHFEGGGGFVDVHATSGKRGSEVTVVTQEWEHQAKQFLEKL